jgi:hypothetical protein
VAAIRINFQSMTDKVPGIHWPYYEVQEEEEDLSGKHLTTDTVIGLASKINKGEVESA